MFSGAPFSTVPFSALEDAAAPVGNLRLLAPGRSPRLILDFGGACLRPELQLFHVLAGSGIMRRGEESRFETPEATPETDDVGIQLEDAVRTSDRRVSVLYSDRSSGPGTYELKRIDSVPFPAEKIPPPAPRFVFTNPASLGFYLGGPWHDQGITSTDERTLGVQVPLTGTVHAIELQCRTTYPTGYVPSWPEQNQTYEPGGVLPPGIEVAFSINLTHGGHTMSPVAFRARARDDTDPLNPCYSAWRYYLAGYYDPTLAAFDTYTPVGTAVDITYSTDQILMAGGSFVQLTWEAFFVGTRLSSTSFRAVGRASVGGPFSIFHDWITTVRAYMPVEFQDENGRYLNFTLISQPSADAGEGNAPYTGQPLTQIPWDFE